jgi:RHS repeat-associated protein
VYTRSTHTLSLLNDAGTDWTAAAVGTGPGLQNSQCAVNTLAAGASPNGNTWTMHVPITFASTFTGIKNIYLNAVSEAGPSSGWQDRGDWGASCTYSVTPGSQTVGAAAGSLIVSVTTTAGCPWTAPASSGFLSLSGGGGTAGSGSATYSFGSHSGDPRSTQVTVAGAAVSVMQTGSVPGASEQVLYYHTDAIGSVRVLTDATGQVYPNAQTRYDYLPYGVLWLEPLNKEQLLFTGKERDQETSLDYFGARHFARATARFTSTDPNHGSGRIFDPQSWNGYAYARNNPLRFVDPDGREYVVCDYKSGTCAGGISDQYFESVIMKNPGSGLTVVPAESSGDLAEGYIYSSLYDTWVAYYKQERKDPTFDSVVTKAGQLAAAMVNAAAKEVAKNAAIAVATLGTGVIVGSTLEIMLASRFPIVFKTGHYAARLLAAGVDVGRAEASVQRLIQAGSPLHGTIVVDGVLLEYRAARLIDGRISVGTIFPQR